MTSVLDYSPTDLSNSSIHGTSIAENCPPANLNNMGRGIMADIAKWVHALSGKKETAGTADAQILTTDFGWSAYADMLIAFRAGTGLTNTGAAMTLNVDGLGAQAVKYAGADPPAGAVTAGQIYLVAYKSSASQFHLLTPTLSGVFQPLSTNLTEWATLNPSANGGSLVTAADYSAMRTLLSLGTAALLNSPIPVANGGTASTTAADARAALGAAPAGTTSALPIGYTGLMEYTGAVTIGDGDETSGAQVKALVNASDGASFSLGSGTTQTGTMWKNISGGDMLTSQRSIGMMVRIS